MERNTNESYKYKTATTQDTRELGRQAETKSTVVTTSTNTTMEYSNFNSRNKTQQERRQQQLEQRHSDETRENSRSATETKAAAAAAVREIRQEATCFISYSERVLVSAGGRAAGGDVDGR